MRSKKADICLILEGTYPYVAGGVSTWTHDLILAQKEISFRLLTLLPSGAELEQRFELPTNVIDIQHLFVQKLPDGSLSGKEARQFVERLSEPLSDFLQGGRLDSLRTLLELIDSKRFKLGAEPLLNSKAAWEMLLEMYRRRLSDNSFLDYFWTWRAALSSFYSLLLCDIPEADLYHPVSTGYAGLFAARAHLETGRPVILTEHGIYTNERRIEIAMANWLYEVPREGLGIDSSRVGLKEIWVELFASYSNACYEACSQIITLYEGNQILQLEEGADPQKLRIIPNGIDFERFSSVERNGTPHPPTVALIGRVVPIKDVKTFIRACEILRKEVPQLRAFVMGPTDEDPDYYQECVEMVKLFDLRECLSFTGKVRLEDYLGEVDILALTSISEAQPLVILEAGAAGIPSVATDVGACRDMILGANSEQPELGPAGAITSLSNPQQTAQALSRLLTDPEWYARCSEAIQKRVQLFFNKTDLDQTYSGLYEELLTQFRSETEIAS